MQDATEVLVKVIQALDPHVVGIAGPPGGGKSTLAHRAAERLGPRTLVLSMDDYYLSRRDRAERGLEWRGGPGTHDLGGFRDVLDRARNGRVPLELQRFSAAADDRIEPVTLDVAPDRVVVEGWVLGHRADGYEAVLDRLDLLVYFGVPIKLARARRFAREAKLRAQGGGFSEERMQRFWDEVLAPGLERWVADAKRTADLVLEVDDSGVLQAIDARNAAVSAALDGA